MRILSRGIIGHVEDKVFYHVIGGRDSGKCTLQECVKTAFGGYIVTATLPVAKSMSSGDPAADNRSVLTLNQHIARIAYANEAKTIHGKPAVLDGNYLQGVIASGGDEITARLMRGNEVTPK